MRNFHRLLSSIIYYVFSACRKPPMTYDYPPKNSYLPPTSYGNTSHYGPPKSSYYSSSSPSKYGSRSSFRGHNKHVNRAPSSSSSSSSPSSSLSNLSSSYASYIPSPSRTAQSSQYLHNQAHPQAETLSAYRKHSSRSSRYSAPRIPSSFKSNIWWRK